MGFPCLAEMCLVYVFMDITLNQGQSLRKRINIPTGGVRFSHNCYPNKVVSQKDYVNIVGFLSRDGLLSDLWSGVLDFYIEPVAGRSHKVCGVSFTSCSGSQAIACRCTSVTSLNMYFSVTIRLTSEMNNSRVVAFTSDEVNFTSEAATIKLERVKGQGDFMETMPYDWSDSNEMKPRSGFLIDTFLIALVMTLFLIFGTVSSIFVYEYYDRGKSKSPKEHAPAPYKISSKDILGDVYTGPSRIKSTSTGTGDSSSVDSESYDSTTS